MPLFVRRVLRLLEARRALYEGAPERALGALRDPSLTLSPQADQLRRRAMEALFRSAAHKASQGRDASVARVLGVVASEDPRRADEWRRHLVPPAVEPVEPRSSNLRALLAQMRAGKADGADQPRREEQQPSSVHRLDPPAGAALRFHLAVDDGGEYLALSGKSLSFGHARAAAADVPLLADLESVHARISFGESFHGGPTWHVQPVGLGRVSVDGRVADGVIELHDGAQVRLSEHVGFRFWRPDPASASARVELLKGLEAEGATRLLLFAPGSAGRVRIGPKTNRHVPIAGVEQEIELSLEPADEPTELIVRCGGGVRLIDGPTGLGEVRLPCPPDRRIDVVLGARPSSQAPFGLAITPVEDRPTIHGGSA
ncbi:MAG: FHA domain-containing protein [Planctomycetota bacterium]|nr:FHA domain-containing protein [Planctomycetota bacterium]